MQGRKVIVVGGGLAGLSAAMRLAEKGCSVDIVSVTHVKRSHSVCAQGGINAVVDESSGDSPLNHAYETIKGGDFLADQAPIVEMCLSAPKIIDMMDRFGCPFNRKDDGSLDRRGFGGTLFKRTIFCGASTGQQLLYTLDEQVRRFESAGLIRKFETHEFIRCIIDDDGRCRGIVMMDLFNLKLEVLKADAVVLATGGLGFLFKMSTNSTFCTGAASGRIYRQGADYANGEFVQIHPTGIPGADKLRLISESVRGEGGRVWVWGDSTKTIQNSTGEELPCGETGKPWFFLEELYPSYGNLVPRDIAARELLRVCEMGLGINGENKVHLDVTHLPKEKHEKLASVLEIYEKFTGEDPTKTPMCIFPAVHYTMGGIWVDWPAYEDSDRNERFRQMTSIKGCFNVGESDYLFHGANRLGANSLLSCIFSGLIVGDEMPRYLGSLQKSYKSIPKGVFERNLEEEKSEKKRILENKGTENVFKLHDELSKVLVNNLTVKRNNKDLQKSLDKIKEIKERMKLVGIHDHSPFANQTFIFAYQYGPMLDIAEAIAISALERNESRGSHFKPEFPERNDEKFLKHTMCHFTADGPKVNFKSVDARYIEPVLRDYTTTHHKTPDFKNLPENIPLPV